MSEVTLDDVRQSLLDSIRKYAQHPGQPANDVRNWATAYGILTDKALLLEQNSEQHRKREEERDSLQAAVEDYRYKVDVLRRAISAAGIPDPLYIPTPRVDANAR